MTAAVGTHEGVYCDGDTGLFGTLFKAWAHHWIVCTSPEDWWLPVITRVAQLVDQHADDDAVRQLFVAGKKEKEVLTVEVNSFTIYDTDYSFVFEAFSDAINSKIHVPGYVDAVTCSFSTTDTVQRIASQVFVACKPQHGVVFDAFHCALVRA